VPVILLIDAGNSRFKWAGLERGRLSPMQAKRYDSHRPASSVVEALGAVSPSRVVCASVLGQAFDRELETLLEGRFQAPVELVRTAPAGHGVRIAYPRPERLGVDRYVALIAAHVLFPGPCIVVDCGTAVTIDAVSRDGVHRGGLILPGLGLMRDALTSRAARIGTIDPGAEPALFARDTGEAVQGGTLRALAGAIDAICAQMESEMGAVQRVICGGEAPRLLPVLQGAYHGEPALVLRGLAVIARS
jgi:type III pantothenate kinase